MNPIIFYTQVKTFYLYHYRHNVSYRLPYNHQQILYVLGFRQFPNAHLLQLLPGLSDEFQTGLVDIKQVTLRLEVLHLLLYAGQFSVSSAQQRVGVGTRIREELQAEEIDSEVLLFLLVTFNLKIQLVDFNVLKGRDQVFTMKGFS